MPGGADGQVGWAAEATPGTAVTVDTFQPFTSESIKQNIDYMDTQTISARKVLRLTKQGTKSVEGTISTELPNVDLALLLYHAFGAVDTSGSDPFTHVFTPADLTGKALTIQVGRPASDGTVHPFTYSGCKISSWSLSCAVGEIATIEVSILGMTETTETVLASASYDSGWEPFVFTEGSIEIDGSPVGTVKNLTLNGDNAVELRHRLGSATSKEPLEIGLRTYDGTIVTDFDDLTHYNLFVAGTPVKVIAHFDNGTESLEVEVNAQFTGETPEVGGFDLLEQSLPYRVMSGVSDADGITATLVNSEADPSA